MSIVLEVGYRNGIYYKWNGVGMKAELVEESEVSDGSVVIWRQIIEAKVNPGQFIEKLIKQASIKIANNNSTTK